MMDLLTTVWCWSIGLSVFVVLALAVLVAAVLLPVRRYDPFLKWACRALLAVCFIRVRVEGDVPAEGSVCVYLGNHVNIFDPLVYCGYLPNVVRGVELESHFRWPVYGWVIRRVGNIPIAQAYRRDIHRSYRAAWETLRNGISVVILPEGHRTRDGSLLPFSRAPFAFAREAGVPIVPVALVGAYRVKRKGSLRIRPGTILLRVGRAISAEDAARLEPSKLRETVYAEISKLLGQGETEVHRMRETAGLFWGVAPGGIRKQATEGDCSRAH